MSPFPLYNEKLLVEDVDIISWCPTADLVLLVSQNNSITLYRNGIDLIWHYENKIKSNIKIVTWKPNGKEFVLGCDNGTVYKVDITHHSPNIIEYLVTEEPSPITTASWINYEHQEKKLHCEGFDPDAFDVEASLPTLSEEPPVEPITRMPRPRTKKSILPPKPLQNTEAQTLLFVGNERGEIHLFLNGVFSIGFISVKHNDKNISIIDTSLADNTESIQILAKPEGPEHKYVLYFLDTRILELRKKEILSILETQTRLDYLLQYTSATIDVLKRHHDSYSRSTKNVVNEANSYITDHQEGAIAMPEVELIGTLATGVTTAPIQELFAEYLNKQCIKQWESNVSHGHKNSKAVLCEHILPACDRIQLALSKLLGYSLWKQRYGEFLEVEAVKKCIDCIQNLIIELFQFSKSLGCVMKRFSAFIAWLKLVSHKVEGPTSDETEPPLTICDEPELVVEYLQNDFTKDSLARYFSPSDSTKSLSELFLGLKQSCSEMLKKPSKTISTKMQVVSCMEFSLKDVCLTHQPRNRVVSIKKKLDDINTDSGTEVIPRTESVLYAFVTSGPDAKLLLLQKAFDNNTLKYAQFNINGTISDFEFFDQVELALLVQTDQETSKLQTIDVNQVIFKDFKDNEEISDMLAPSRELELDRMIDVKIGCNGLPRRRLFGLVASNGQLKVHFMSDDEDSEDMEED